MIDDEVKSRNWLYSSLNRRRRAALLVAINRGITKDYAMSLYSAQTNQNFAVGNTTFKQKAAANTAKYGIPLARQIEFETAQRNSHANLLLEGFGLDNEVLMLNERVIMGEINMEQKLALIRQFYAR